jgi:hypothetical protein
MGTFYRLLKNFAPEKYRNGETAYQGGSLRNKWQDSQAERFSDPELTLLGMATDEGGSSFLNGWTLFH